MKRYLTILFTLLLSSFSLLAQDGLEDDDKGGGRLQQRMQEYIQKRLNMSKGEAEKFSPVFIRYIFELRKTHREFKSDVPMRQLKVAELRVRFRDQFRQVLDERRANRIYEVEKEFIRIVQTEADQRNKNRLQNRRGPGARTNFAGPRSRLD